MKRAAKHLLILVSAMTALAVFAGSASAEEQIVVKKTTTTYATTGTYSADKAPFDAAMVAKQACSEKSETFFVKCAKEPEPTAGIKVESPSADEFDKEIMAETVTTIEEYSAGVVNKTTVIKGAIKRTKYSDIRETVLTEYANGEKSKVTSTKDSVIKAARDKKDEFDRSYLGLSFGVGLSGTFFTGSEVRVKSAVLDENGKVRVEKDDDIKLRPVLETHFLINWDQIRSEPDSYHWPNFGFGPFVALVPGDSKFLQSYGLGIMMAWRPRSYENPKGRAEQDKANNSFNLGVGYVWESGITVLGDGIEENRRLPAGETKLRLREKTEGGVIVLTSFTW